MNSKEPSIVPQKKSIYESYIQPLLSKIPKVDETNKPYYKINSMVGKVIFILFIVIIFIVLFNLGMFLLNYFSLYSSSYNSQTFLVKGIANGTNPLVINQDMTNDNNKLLLRSNNKESGAEFTWSIWLNIKDIVSNGKPATFQNIFNKGNNQYDSISGIATVNNAPGLYLSKSTNSLRVIMDTVSPNPKTDNKHSDITNIPLGKWFHVIIRLQNRTLDTYINGIITSRLYLINVPKQNYDPIHICNNSGFFGDYSDLSYFNYALPITKIQSMVHTGPRLSYSEQHIQSSNSTLSRGSTNNYLSPLWYFNGNASDYEITPPDEETTTTTTTNGKDKDTAKTNLPANSGDVFVDEHKINNENYDASGNLVEKGIVLTNQDSLKEDVGKAEATVTELRQDSIPFSLNDTRFSTPFSSLMGGDVRALDNHNIDCGNTSINSFNYNNPGDGTFNYKYSCNNVGGGTLNTTDFLPTSTMFSDTTGKVTDLKTQKVECENNSVLSQFKLVNNTAIGDEKNASQLQYQYKCLKSNEPKPLTCRTLNTSSSSTTDNSRFLSKANIKCNPNEALSGFQYVNDGSNKFHYSYTCCSTAYST